MCMLLILQCEHRAIYGIIERVTTYDDPEILSKYPQLDCGETGECYAWCSDGIWDKDESLAKAKEGLRTSTYCFAIIDLVLEAVCALVAFFYAIFGTSICCEPVKTTPFSFFILFALSTANFQEGLSYSITGRLVLLFHLVDDIVSMALVGPLLVTMWKSYLSKNIFEEQWELFYLFLVVRLKCFYS